MGQWGKHLKGQYTAGFFCNPITRWWQILHIVQKIRSTCTKAWCVCTQTSVSSYEDFLTSTTLMSPGGADVLAGPQTNNWLNTFRHIKSQISVVQCKLDNIAQHCFWILGLWDVGQPWRQRSARCTHIFRHTGSRKTLFLNNPNVAALF